MNKVDEEYSRIYKENGFIILLGGDHSVTIPSLDALSRAHEDTLVLCLDAHLDYLEEVNGVGNTNQSVMYHASYKLGLSVIMVGYRNVATSSSVSVKKFVDDGNKMIRADECDSGALDTIAAMVRGRNVYLSLDLDGINPSEAPGVGTPSSGGVPFAFVVKMISVVFESANVIGADVVELCPPYDYDGRTALLAAQFVLEIASRRVYAQQNTMF